jgi:hypothetical protein
MSAMVQCCVSLHEDAPRVYAIHVNDVVLAFGVALVVLTTSWNSCAQLHLEVGRPIVEAAVEKRN